jgi:hypothetical protein
MKNKLFSIYILLLFLSCTDKRPTIYYNRQDNKISIKESDGSIFKIEIYNRKSNELIKIIKSIQTQIQIKEVFLENIDTSKFSIIELDSIEISELQFHVEVVIKKDTQNLHYFTFSNQFKTGENVKEIKSIRYFP